ncbi:MAG: 16S rRNA (adenine(1518)-N(6)/adenine(1519)-N(6))-dimethyltransferase RsmA [Edaphobacter sp.]|uniref:16S rRNA (adenine(1518)-N(6)/adenine(1519)-N(6))- dimethyltransferase RsmA n=1 Tax=Edaphobacter sp. TaxID=1934404 RepID=UPI0023A3FF39|nr:16S rRNA (adenine(1518)-N(6)/adenine(1519)-N(6))-dimethyltransferase RsmA [Edaphobacter sp.]MDE1175405.1 16S rRNA (adenine(1518)-N(6)/adenine(1519)-N(6))-dimethyltransferase RsmA [Edaphobacter sp.]
MKRKPKLGQNFLTDDRARHAIADALGDIRQRTVIEIGPGKGAITDILVPRAGHLVALELDRELAPALAARYADTPTIRVIEDDVLRIDLASIIPSGETADVIGNLPYYITSDILLKLFAAGAAGHLRRAVVMMQREVADRVAASPGVRDYGLLSATAQMNASVEHLFTLSPSSFSPPPEVFSSVLRLTFAPRYGELQVDPEGFDRFLKQSFAQKRKTLENNLRAAGFSPQHLAQAWPASIPKMARAEALTLEEMSELYRALAANA